MKRQLRPASSLRASGDRWLFGYADIVTLLFACFASLYAAQLVPASAEPAQAPQAPPAAQPAEPARTTAPTPLAEKLAELLAREHGVPGVEISTSNRGLVISLPEAGSFPPGRAEFSDAARAVIFEVATTLRDMPNLIRVEGHTDDVPIHTSAFASNWELSTARATRVVQFLIDGCGVDADRLSAAGYAEHRPRVPNDTPDARARNRRVDIVVIDPATAAIEDPGKVSR